jgi:hypothetical protein
MRCDDRCIIEGQSADRDHLPGASRLWRCLQAYLTQVKRDISTEIHTATATDAQAHLRHRRVHLTRRVQPDKCKRQRPIGWIAPESARVLR